MSAQTTMFAGQYYDGQRAIGYPVMLDWQDGEVVVKGADIDRRYGTRQLSVSPRIARAPRFVALPDGGQLQCADHPLLDVLPQEVRSEGLVAWLEKKWGVALASVAAIVVALVAGYFYGVPAAAKWAAARVPQATEEQLGEHVLSWLDSGFMMPTSLAYDRQAAIEVGFFELLQGIRTEQSYRLELRNSRVLGANAFALPGGTIVITDKMIEMTQSNDEVFAVLAHEIGHVEHRHTMRHLLQSSATAVVAATMTADAASTSLAVAGLPVILVRAKYSREFETEADDFAFKLLKARGIPPEAFATLMERLTGYAEKASFLSTHPPSADRAMRARAAAEK